MAHNAGRLAAWVEWLRHPEEHEYDRVVIYPDGTKREESQRVTRANPTPGHYAPIELPFESVIAQFDLEQFLDGMAAFATQQVERPGGQLAYGAATMKNIWWLGDARMMRLIHEFPDEDEWNSPAATTARTFVGEMATAVTQLNKIASEFADMVPRYALIVTGARDNLDRAAADLVTAFETKFGEKPSAISIDIKGIVIAAIVAGATAFVTGPMPLVTSAAIGGAWSRTFDEAAKVLFGDGRAESRGAIEGFWWIDLAKTYMRAQADILADAITSMNNLVGDYNVLIAQFDQDVKPLLEKDIAGEVRRMNSTCSSGRRPVLVALVCCLAAASCATPEPVPPPPDRDRPTVAVPKDRQEGAVVDALRRLDLCAVLGNVVPDRSGLSARTPFACSAQGVTVSVDRLDAEERLPLPSRVVGGAKAYDDGCRVWLPVSFALALKFYAESGCDNLAERVVPAAAVLASDPAAVQGAPRWEACAAMRTVPGMRVGEVEALDSCVDREIETVFELSYGTPGNSRFGDWRTDTVGGVEVRTLDDRDPQAPACVTEWAVGPPVTSHAKDQLVARIRALDCGQVTPLVEPLIATLRTNPGDGDPQRPLLYAPDESDSPFPGACAYLDIPDRTDCIPYIETPVPPDPTSVTDPNVFCAVAKDAVAEEFGPVMAPVTTEDTCYFVEPERQVQIRFTLRPVPLREFGDGGEPVTIAGHPGFVTAGAGHVVTLSTSSTGRPGTLVLELDAGPAATQLPPATTDKAEPVLAGLVRQHFS